MLKDILIRPYKDEDLAQVQALEARVTPYRPEDQAAVEAMYARARQAQVTGDRWMAQTPSLPGMEQAAATHLAMWVAVLPAGAGAEQVIGLVAVDRAATDLELPVMLPWAQAWRRRNDVADLRRLRVAPEHARQGIGAQLTETAISWCRGQGFRTLIVNTTTPQVPALRLYQKHGFQEAGRSFVGRYELVWLELIL